MAEKQGIFQMLSILSKINMLGFSILFESFKASNQNKNVWNSDILFSAVKSNYPIFNMSVRNSPSF